MLPNDIETMFPTVADLDLLASRVRERPDSDLAVQNLAGLREHWVRQDKGLVPPSRRRGPDVPAQNRRMELVMALSGSVAWMGEGKWRSLVYRPSVRRGAADPGGPDTGSSPESAGPVLVPRLLFAVLETLRTLGPCNMLDRLRVIELAEEMNFHVAADWIRANPGLYSRGVLRGFEPTDSER